MRRRPLPLLAPAAAALLVLAAPASAVPVDRPQVLSRWTQTAASSQEAWLAARAHRADWTAYGFDWTTDYCTSSPDNPFGFPFAEACARHDFGYRNYRAPADFQANKPRLDDAFHADLERVCARYKGARRTSCDGTAWTYYQAVKTFGTAPAEPTPAAPPTP